MARTDFIKSLQGKFLKGERGPSNQQKRLPRGESYRKKLSLTPNQKSIIQNYINGELALYNHLLENLQARVKRDPQFLLNLTEKQRLLFPLLTKQAFNVNDLDHKKFDNCELPDYLEPYRELLFGVINGKQYGMNEKLKFFYEMCSKKSSVLVDTRERMAYELLEFFITQAKNLNTKINTSDGPQYKNTPEFLEVVNNLQKRHIQIGKNKIKIEINSEKGQSKIYLPHVSEPLVVDDDLSTIPDWTVAIIHKDPNSLPIGNKVEWEIDFRNTPNKYLVKYLESANPNSQFVGRFVGLKL